jgi:hypothetical protein
MAAGASSCSPAAFGELIAGILRPAGYTTVRDAFHGDERTIVMEKRLFPAADQASVARDSPFVRVWRAVQRCRAFCSSFLQTKNGFL